ncbi:MAG: hypothetical protein ACHQHN_01660 [Sphingobacteriales bacterium]
MDTNKNKPIKPASNDPVKEALGHPNGPGLEEMLNGQEEKKLKPGQNSKKAPENPDIPVI